MRRAIISFSILAAYCIFFASACQKEASANKSCRVEVVFDTGTLGSKSSDPKDEDAVNDVNLFVFNSLSGMMESHIYLDKKTYLGKPVSMNLLTNIEYEVAACLNFGYKLPDINTIAELPSFKYYMVYPDDYSVGVPMSAFHSGFVAGQGDSPLILQAERLLAKITLSVDRSDLNKDVKMTVLEAEIGGCPRYVTPFSDSKPDGRNDVFQKGFFKKGINVDNLNTSSGEDGKSKEVNLFMFESIGGDLPEMDNPTLAAVYPYIQLRMSYLGPDAEASSGKWVNYRFCIGEEEGSANIKRNTRYHFTVCPHGTGLDGAPSWKVEITN